MLRILTIFLLAVSALAENPTTPVWDPVFQSEFTESYPDTPTHVRGKVYYDTTVNMMRVDRQDGQHDMFCSSVNPNVSTPCILLMRENKRYIVYPAKRLCCYCCNDAHGCGVP